MTALAVLLAGLLGFAIVVATIAMHRKADADAAAREAERREQEEKAAKELAQAKLVTAARERDAAKDRARRSEAGLAVVREIRNKDHDEKARTDAPGGATSVDAALDRLDRLRPHADRGGAEAVSGRDRSVPGDAAAPAGKPRP